MELVEERHIRLQLLGILVEERHTRLPLLIQHIGTRLDRPLLHITLVGRHHGIQVDQQIDQRLQLIIRVDQPLIRLPLLIQLLG